MFDKTIEFSLLREPKTRQILDDAIKKRFKVFKFAKNKILHGYI